MLLNMALYDAAAQTLRVERLEHMGAGEALRHYYRTYASTPCDKKSGQAWYDLLQARPHVDYLRPGGSTSSAYEVTPSKRNFLVILGQLFETTLGTWAAVGELLSTPELAVTTVEQEAGVDEGVIVMTTKCRRTGRMQSATLDIRWRHHTYVRLHGTQRAYATRDELDAVARRLATHALVGPLLCLLASAETTQRPVPARIVAEADGADGRALLLALLCAPLSAALGSWLKTQREGTLLDRAVREVATAIEAECAPRAT